MMTEHSYAATATIDTLLRPVRAVHELTRCADVLELFHNEKKLYSLPVVNDDGQPVGIIIRQEITDDFSKPYSKELNGKKPIFKVMNKNPIIVDKSTGIEDVARIVLDAGMQHMVSGFIVTAEKKYIGMANGYDLLNEITILKQKHLFELAHFDQLTGLPNRRLLLDRLQHALDSSARSEMQSALMFIDLDNFKSINDTLGHSIGDLLLKQVAQRLSACLRKGDTVARLGGDEFVILLEDLSANTLDAAEGAEAIGEKILAALNEPFQLEENECHCTPSIGATLIKDSKLHVDEFLKQADIAMYQAKKAGRNALRFFDAQMQANITARSMLEASLREALENRQFQIHYQVQVDHQNRPLGAEALIRWYRPDEGMVSPAVFIPLAEETGMILPIGQWVLESACAQIKKWESTRHTQHLQLAVNVSARQFFQNDFVDQVKKTVLEFGINPSRLKLELTESLALNDINDTIEKMQELRNFGVQFAMDDFGTGHSSLSSLKKLPLDQLKIDQTFVRDITTDPDDAVIVQTIIVMALHLGMEVIAEGVETEEQRSFLAKHGCMTYQGYLFSRPVPIEAFEALVSS